MKAGKCNEMLTHISIYSVNNVVWRERRNVRVSLHKEGRKLVNEVFPLFLSLTIDGLFIAFQESRRYQSK